MKLIKQFILILITTTLLGFVNTDILDDDNPRWNIDSDRDELPDAFEEIFGTNKNSKDSNNNLISDKDELDNIYRYKLSENYINNGDYKEKNIIISDYMLLKCSSMASESININSVGKTVKEVFNDKYIDLSDFEIVRYENGYKGFGGIALRKDNNIIVAYKPTRSYKEWVENFTTQFMPHPQRKYAIEFIKPIVNKSDDIYITGHSLGGLLAQYATYYLHNDEGYKNIKTVTFNSANTLNPKHMQGKFGPPILKPSLKQEYKESYLELIPKKEESGENNNIVIDASYLIGFINNSIKENGFIDITNKSFVDSDFKDYNNIVTNYIISNDPLYLIINGGYLGNKEIIDVGKENLDFIKDKEKLNKYHSLENFKNILNNK